MSKKADLSCMCSLHDLPPRKVVFPSKFGTVALMTLSCKHQLETKTRAVLAREERG